MIIYFFYSRSIPRRHRSETILVRKIHPPLTTNRSATVSWTILTMVFSFLALAIADDNENEASHAHGYNHEHEDEHHLNQLVYYSIAILPILALFIFLPMCCSMLGVRRRARDIKID